MKVNPIGTLFPNGLSSYSEKVDLAQDDELTIVGLIGDFLQDHEKPRLYLLLEDLMNLLTHSNNKNAGWETKYNKLGYIAHIEHFEEKAIGSYARKFSTERIKTINREGQDNIYRFNHLKSIEDGIITLLTPNLFIYYNKDLNGEVKSHGKFKFIEHAKGRYIIDNEISNNYEGYFHSQ